MGKPQTLRFAACNSKSELLKNIELIFKFLNECNNQFNNVDFRKFFNQFGFKDDVERNNTLIYCDPPYIGTDDNYSDSFTENDSIDLFNCLQETGCKFAMSEFNNEFILNQAKERNLNVITIGERQNLKNRRIEILITNYKTQLKLF